MSGTPTNQQCDTLFDVEQNQKNEVLTRVKVIFLQNPGLLKFNSYK